MNGRRENLPENAGRVLPPLCLLLLLAGASGCSNQDLHRSFVDRVVDPTVSTNAPSESNDQAEALKHAQRMARALAEWGSETNAPLDYHIGPEDVLEIGILSLEEPGKVGKLIRPVLLDGTVNLPWVGAVKVNGFSIREAESAIEAEFKGRLIKEPGVTVFVSEHRSAPVLITGAVNKPGVYYLKSDRRSVLQLLAEADGLSGNAGNELLLVRDQEEVSPETKVSSTNKQNIIVVDLVKLIDEGDRRLNLWVRKGDMITVPPKLSDRIYVLGYIQRPGSFSIDRNNPPGALQALAMAGGLVGAARPENSFLLRDTPTGQQIVPVNLKKEANAVASPTILQPGDTLVVGSSLIGRLAEFVKPSVGVAANYSTTP